MCWVAPSHGSVTSIPSPRRPDISPPEHALCTPLWLHSLFSWWPTLIPLQIPQSYWEGQIWPCSVHQSNLPPSPSPLPRTQSSDFSSVQFSCSVMFDSLWPHGLQHARPPCSLPTARVYSNSCPLSRWCHPAIASSDSPFSSCPQSFPASGSFQMSQLFASGGQSIGVSASISLLPMNTQDWSPLG